MIAYEYDSSRFITGYGVFNGATSENSVSVLEDAIKRHGGPASILSDNGPPFTTNEHDSYENILTSFEHILSNTRASGHTSSCFASKRWNGDTIS